MFNFIITVVEWLRETDGRTEDGEKKIISDYFVQATGADGTRFNLNRAFLGFDRWEEFEDHGGLMVRHGNKALADRVAARIQAYVDAGGLLNLTGAWHEAEPAYGSDAYIAWDTGGRAAAEERERDEFGAAGRFGMAL